MNSSKDGIVLFSLGSVAQPHLVPPIWRESFCRAFEAFPTYTFVWRFKPPMEECKHLKNLVLSDWIPQADLLREFTFIKTDSGVMIICDW